MRVAKMAQLKCIAYYSCLLKRISPFRPEVSTDELEIQTIIKNRHSVTLVKSPSMNDSLDLNCPLHISLQNTLDRILPIENSQQQIERSTYRQWTENAHFSICICIFCVRDLISAKMEHLSELVAIEVICVCCVAQSVQARSELVIIKFTICDILYTSMQYGTVQGMAHTIHTLNARDECQKLH